MRSQHRTYSQEYASRGCQVPKRQPRVSQSAGYKDVRGTRKRNNLGAERSDEGNAKLGGSDPLLVGDDFQRVDERQVMLEVLRLEPRESPPHVIL